MSGDESERAEENQPRVHRKFTVVRPAWRSPKVTTWLQVFDDAHLDSRFSQSGRATRGSWVRHRVRSNSRVDDAHPPVTGLPRNFYDEGWLRHLSESELDALDMRAEVNLEHDPSLME